jgi:hypothetical protein
MRPFPRDFFLPDSGADMRHVIARSALRALIQLALKYTF